MIRSLTGRLLVTFAFVLAVALGILALYVGHEERKAMLFALETDLGRNATLLAGEVPRRPVADGDREELDRWADRMGGLLGLRVTVIGADGAVLGDSEVPFAGLGALENHARRPEVLAARERGTGRDIRRSASVKTEYLYVARSLGPRAGAVVRVALPIEQARGHVRGALRALWTMAAVALALAFVLLLWSTRPLSRRLRAFEDTARRLEAGDLSARVSEEGRDEITDLARLVNRMAAGLRGTLERVEAERDVREEMLAAMTDGVVLLDADGAIVHANAALVRALGQTHAPRTGERFAEWCRLPELDQFLSEARRAEKTHRREIRLRGPSERALEAASSRLADGSMLLVVRDLSPIRHLERVRQDFVANVSHELRTPLTSILGYAETLLDGGLEDEEHRRQFVETIRNQAARLKAIVDDLLVLAELDRPDTALALGPVDLKALVRSVTTALEPRARRDGLTLELEAPAHEVIVQGERVRLEQVLFNLVDNALKYTEEGGVRVRLERANGQAAVAVEDTGPGIPNEALQRVFERFYRVDAARSRDVPGTGLGLSIVRHIVDLHGGRVEVANLPEGGARFTVRIPLF
ncbi:MAG: ATP-binding protein [Candidatus Eiseniibacteriota bacterium]